MIPALLTVVGIGVLVCHILVIVKMFQNGKTGLGVATILLTFCFGIGYFISLIYGWMKATPWGMKNLMLAYTVLLVVQIVLFGVYFPQLQQQMLSQPGFGNPAIPGPGPVPAPAP